MFSRFITVLIFQITKIFVELCNKIVGILRGLISFDRWWHSLHVPKVAHCLAWILSINVVLTSSMSLVVEFLILSLLDTPIIPAT